MKVIGRASQLTRAATHSGFPGVFSVQSNRQFNPMRRYRISFVRLVFYGLVTLALSGKRIEHEGRDDVCVDIEAAVGNILGHGPPLRVACGPAYSLPSNPV